MRSDNPMTSQVEYKVPVEVSLESSGVKDTYMLRFQTGVLQVIVAIQLKITSLYFFMAI